MTLKSKITAAHNHPLASPLKSTMENDMLKWGYIGTYLRETLSWYADVWKTACCRSNFKQGWLKKSPFPVRFFTEIFTSRASRESISAVPTIYAGFAGGGTLLAGVIGAIKTVAPLFLLKAGGLAVVMTVAAPLAAVTVLTVIAYPAFTAVGLLNGVSEAVRYVKSPKNYTPPGVAPPPAPEPTREEVMDRAKEKIISQLYEFPAEDRKILFVELRKAFNEDYGDMARTAVLKGTPENIKPMSRISVKPRKKP